VIRTVAIPKCARCGHEQQISVSVPFASNLTVLRAGWSIIELQGPLPADLPEEQYPKRITHFHLCPDCGPAVRNELPEMLAARSKSTKA
jgi:hypothetical protein